MENREWWLDPNKIILSHDQITKLNQRPLCVHRRGVSKTKGKGIGLAQEAPFATGQIKAPSLYCYK